MSISVECPFYVKILSILTSNKKQGEVSNMDKYDLAEFLLESDYCPDFINGLCDDCGLCEVINDD